MANPSPATAKDSRTEPQRLSPLQPNPKSCTAVASIAFSGLNRATAYALYRYRGFAKSHAEKPDLDAALADYAEAVRLEPNSFVPFILRANIYAGKGEQELAIKDYDRAIELSPRADFYNNRGNALRKTGKVDLAIADLDQAIKLDANYFGAYWNRGLAYQDKGDKEKAADDYKKALTVSTPTRAREKRSGLAERGRPRTGEPARHAVASDAPATARRCQ